MKCPMMFNVKYSVEVVEEGSPWECLKEECAWWDESMAMCGVIALKAELAGCCLWLVEIADKMPHEAQFRT